MKILYMAWIDGINESSECIVTKQNIKNEKTDRFAFLRLGEPLFADNVIHVVVVIQFHINAFIEILVMPPRLTELVSVNFL